MKRSPVRWMVCLAGLAAGLVARPAVAQTLGLSRGLDTASLGRMRLSFSLVPAPVGSFKTNVGNVEVSADAAFAFGLRPAFDYSINDYFFIGASPQFLFNVKGKNDDSSGKEFDLLLRVGGHAPVADKIHLYGYLSPGYSVIYPPTGNNNASGFVLGVTGGAIYSFPGNVFAVADLGYQFGYQKVSTGNFELDLKSSYLLIGLGAGVKL